jgi:hypothetical protein
MEKTYLTDLREWVDKKKGLNSSRANSARVVFLAIRDDVKLAIDAGYSLVTIWEHMHETGRVTTTYETFRRHVKRFIKQQPPVSPPTIKPGERTATSTKKQNTQSLSVDNEVQKGHKISDRNTTEKKEQTVLPAFKFAPNKKK